MHHCNNTELSNMVPLINLIVLIATLICIIFYTRFTSRSNTGQTYFKIMKSVNSRSNTQEIESLIKMVNYKQTSLTNIDDWNEESSQLARVISSRYQIIAHLVERGFLERIYFFENFSGTLLQVWDICAPYISKRRSEYQNTIYFRRDLERLALESWIYQYNLGFKIPVTILDENSKPQKYNHDKETLDKVKNRIKQLKRENGTIAYFRIRKMMK
jgi:hypothetical protein